MKKITDTKWNAMDAEAREKYLVRAIRSLPAGGRSRTELHSELQAVTGSVFASILSQKEIRGLAANHPELLDHSFTLGLDEVIVR